MYEPEGLPDGVSPVDLQDTRITQQEFADGTCDVLQDKWGLTPRPGDKKKPRSNAGVTRMTKGAWRGTSWFFLAGVNPIPGPARRRITGKKNKPLFVTEEWELLKKLRTDPEYKRSALVDSLSVQGIERTQLAASQRKCPDLSLIHI